MAINKRSKKAASLVQAWLNVELEENGKNLAEALDDLNKKLKTAHTHSRVREWETNRNGRGERLPRELRLFMGKKVIKSVLVNAGVDTKKLSTKDYSEIVEQLT